MDTFIQYIADFCVLNRFSSLLHSFPSFLLPLLPSYKKKKLMYFIYLLLEVLYEWISKYESVVAWVFYYIIDRWKHTLLCNCLFKYIKILSKVFKSLHRKLFITLFIKYLPIELMSHNWFKQLFVSINHFFSVLLFNNNKRWIIWR